MLRCACSVLCLVSNEHRLAASLATTEPEAFDVPACLLADGTTRSFIVALAIALLLGELAFAAHLP